MFIATFGYVFVIWFILYNGKFLNHFIYEDFTITSNFQIYVFELHIHSTITRLG